MLTLVTQQGWPLIGLWCDWQRSGGTPETTLTLRRYYLQRLARDFAGRSPLTLTEDDLAGWFGAHSWSPATKRTVRTSLRCFYGWLRDTGRMPYSPAHALPRVRLPRGRPRPTPEATYRAAIERADDRTRLAIMLAGQCGLRRGEIARAQREDVERDLSGWSLRVTGKGGHERIVPLPDALAETILTKPAGWLFPSPAGGHLTPHWLGRTISAALGSGLGPRRRHTQGRTICGPCRRCWATASLRRRRRIPPSLIRPSALPSPLPPRRLVGLPPSPKG